MVSPQPLQVEVTLGNRHALATGVQHLPVAATRIGGQVLLQVGPTEAWLTAAAAAKLGRVLLDIDPPAEPGKHDHPAEARGSRIDDVDEGPRAGGVDL